MLAFQSAHDLLTSSQSMTKSSSCQLLRRGKRHLILVPHIGGLAVPAAPPASPSGTAMRNISLSRAACAGGQLFPAVEKTLLLSEPFPSALLFLWRSIRLRSLPSVARRIRNSLCRSLQSPACFSAMASLAVCRFALESSDCSCSQQLPHLARYTVDHSPG